jgi:ergothioneine biosynthesis protein EgtC
MCRLLAYKGAPIIMNKLLYEPRNSIIHQSFDAREIEEPLNGDGFGVGWYVPELDREPAVFVSMAPAWSNRNLKYLSPKIRSGCIFAHVRAASFGDIAEANCHPFHCGPFMMMHNGSIEGFDQIKRRLRQKLSDEVYGWVRGQTDSEHFFALFLDRVRTQTQVTAESMADALQDAIDEVEAMKRAHKIKDGTYLNAIVTDGQNLVATRFVTTDEEPLTLYFSEGSRYVCEDGVCRMIKAAPGEHAVLVVSEKLTSLRNDWKKVPANHMILVSPESDVSFREIKVKGAKRASA